MNKELINKMVAAATDVISKQGDGQNHTVSGAVATDEGKIFTGINFYHFTGGPCGEITALANAIANGEKDLTTIVAIGDRDRGVLAPCGRCRQTIFDYYPNMRVIVAKNGENITLPIRELLPDTFEWQEQQTDVTD